MSISFTYVNNGDRMDGTIRKVDELPLTSEGITVVDGSS